MQAQLHKRTVSILCSLTLMIVSLSCSKSSKVEPESVIAAEYELKDLRYFMESGDGIDTVIVKLNGISVQNPGDRILPQTFEDNYESLMKTSQFEIADQQALPKGADLAKFNVRVPESWSKDGSYQYFSKQFPLVSNPQEQPYGFYKKETFDIKIPPKSRLVLDRKIEAYHLNCSFSAVLQNKNTGETFPLTGKWKGISHYNNSWAELTEFPL